MWKILQPPAYKPEMEADKVDAKYKRMRLQVFLGIFIGYAGFYIVRKISRWRSRNSPCSASTRAN